MALRTSFEVAEADQEETAADKANRQAREAMELGSKIKGGKPVKTNPTSSAIVGELDGSAGLTLHKGRLTFVNGVGAQLRAELSAEYPGVDLDAACDKATPEIMRKKYPSTHFAMATLRKWARVDTQLIKKQAATNKFKNESLSNRLDRIQRAKGGTP